ncbi:receptor-type tyrosine-protein phosphatase N2 isoform X1 [Tachysurus ichikawai]
MFSSTRFINVIVYIPALPDEEIKILITSVPCSAIFTGYQFPLETPHLDSSLQARKWSSLKDLKELLTPMTSTHNLYTTGGYTWQDDATQQVISRELLALPKVPLRRLGKNFPAYKLRAQASDGDNRKYLQELGFIPADVTTSKQGLQGKYKIKGMSDLLDLIIEPKARPPPRPSTSLLQPRPGPKHSYWPGLKPVDRTELLDQNGLLSELQQYLQSEPKEPPAAPSQKELQHFQLQHSSPAKAGKVPGDLRRPPRPRIDKLLFRSGANRPKTQDSLSSVDEKFIQGVVKKLGQQSVNMDTLSLNDLDQISEVITQALQVVDDREGVKGREVTVDDDDDEMKREPDAQGQLKETSRQDLAAKDGQTKESKPAAEGKDKVFISQLLDFLDRNSSPEAADETSLLDPLTLPQTPAGLKSAGVEIVQSRTTQTSVDLTKKKMEPDTVDLHLPGDAEVEQWLRGQDDVDADARHKENHTEEGEVEKKGGHVEKKFRVDVTAYSTPRRDEYFGYIITQDSLSTDQGLNLMETLAKRANLRVTDFLQLS